MRKPSGAIDASTSATHVVSSSLETGFKTTEPARNDVPCPPTSDTGGSVTPNASSISVVGARAMSIAFADTSNHTVFVKKGRWDSPFLRRSTTPRQGTLNRFAKIDKARRERAGGDGRHGVGFVIGLKKST
jgi:hypothetical protein